MVALDERIESYDVDAGEREAAAQMVRQRRES